MDKSKLQNKKEWQKFGIVLGIIISIFGTFQLISGKDFYFYFYAIALIVFIIATVFPILLKPIFILFSYFGSAMNWFVLRTFLSLNFFLAFTPIGFLMKSLGRLSFDLKTNKTKKSYWLKREITQFKKDDFENQF